MTAVSGIVLTTEGRHVGSGGCNPGCQGGVRARLPGASTLYCSEAQEFNSIIFRW